MIARKLTQDERKTLSKYEEHMRCASERGYMRWPGMGAVKEVLSVWEAAYGAKYKLNTGCGTCVKNMFADMWRLYSEPQTPSKGRRRK